MRDDSVNGQVQKLQGEKVAAGSNDVRMMILDY